mgnify:CR=1 FL=1
MSDKRRDPDSNRPSITSINNKKPATIKPKNSITITRALSLKTKPKISTNNNHIKK